GLPVLFPLAGPLEVFPALSAALIRRREEQAEQVVGCRLIGCGQGEDRIGPAMQIRAALGSGSGQDKPANQARTKQRQFLRDVAAEREPEDVYFLQAEIGRALV